MLRIIAITCVITPIGDFPLKSRTHFRLTFSFSRIVPLLPSLPNGVPSTYDTLILESMSVGGLWDDLAGSFGTPSVAFSEATDQEAGTAEAYVVQKWRYLTEVT